MAARSFIVILTIRLLLSFYKNKEEQSRFEWRDFMEGVEVNRPYIHFKGRLYYVHSIVEHTETGEKLVVYQALYPPYGMYTRSFEMFIEKIDPKRVDNVTGQEKRFELFTGDLNFLK